MKYTEININNVKVYIARAHRSCHFNLSIHQDGNAYATYPWYSSKKELISFLETKLDWIVESQKKIKSKVPTLDRISKEDFKSIIKTNIEKYIKLFSDDGYNIKVKKFSIRHMTTRLGSCTPSANTIRFSTELCKYQDRYIEYIVVHELAHLVECNHSKKFWEIVKKYVPDYKKMEKFA